MSEEGGPVMTLLEHLEELRKRLLKSIALLAAVLAFWMVYHELLVDFITRPHFRAQELLGVPPHERRLISLDPAGPLVSVLKLAFIVSIFVSSPWIGYQIWAFVGEGLHPHERRHVVRFAPISFLLFVAGGVFGYFVLIPYALYGLASAVRLDVIAPTFTFSHYLSFVMTLTIVMGGVFQVPLVMVFLSRLALVEPAAWGRWRRTAIVANVALAAVVTPSDVLTCLLVAGPLLALYELGALAARLGAGAGSAPPGVVHSGA